MTVALLVTAQRAIHALHREKRGIGLVTAVIVPHLSEKGYRTGTDTNRKNSQSVLGILPADHQGHIVSGALGGTGALNNVWAQNGWLNSNSNSPWPQFELLVDTTLTRMERNKCLTEVTLFWRC